MAEINLRILLQAVGGAQVASEVQSVVQSLGGGGGGGGLGLIGALGGVAVAAAAAAVTIGVQLVQAASKYEDALAQTVQVLKSTHDASGMTIESISNLANSLSTLTPFTNVAVQSAENMLLTFTNIGQNVFPDATKTVLDMSQALGQDTKTSAIQLGKALDDPIKGIGNLQRVGVTFTEDQKKLIKSLVDAGDTAGAQKVILQELQKEFGGSAEAAGHTFAGQLQILQNSFMQVEQRIGMFIIPILNQLIGLIESNVLPVFSKFADWFTNVGIQAFMRFVDTSDIVKNSVGALGTGFSQIPNILGAVQSSFSSIFQSTAMEDFLTFARIGLLQVSRVVGGELASNFKMFTGLAKELGTWWGSTMQPAISASLPGFEYLAGTIMTTVVPAMAKIWAVGQQVTRDMLPPLVKGFEAVAPVVVRLGGFLAKQLGQALVFLAPFAIQAAQALGKFAGDIMSRVIPIVQNLWNGIKAFLDWIKPYWPAIWAGIQDSLINTWDIIKGAVEIAWSLISGIIKVGLDVMSGNWSQAWTDIKDMFGGIWQGIQDIASGAWGNIKAVVIDGIDAVIASINSMIDGVNAVSSKLGIAAIPDIPMLAQGGSNLPAGPYIVGDAGPEMLWLPGGSSVVPMTGGKSVVPTGIANTQPSIVFAPHIIMQGLDEVSLERAGDWMMAYLGDRLRVQYGNV